jgi:hypothetical protein
MSVVHAKNDAFHHNWLGRHFGVCGLCERTLHPPFLWWQGLEHIKICGPCCQKMRDSKMAPMFKAEGFAFDLLEVAATTDIQALRQYKGMCLTRGAVRAEEENGIRKIAHDTAVERIWGYRVFDGVRRAKLSADEIKKLNGQVDTLAGELAQRAIAGL